MRFVGETETIRCSFNDATVTSMQVHSNGETLMTMEGSSISYKISAITDTIHNHEFSCIGVVSGGNNRYLNLTVVALSKNDQIIFL